MTSQENSFLSRLKKMSINEIKSYMSSIKKDIQTMNDDPILIKNKEIYAQYKILVNKTKQNEIYIEELNAYKDKYDIEKIKNELKDYYVLQNKLSLCKKALNEKCRKINKRKFR